MKKLDTILIGFIIFQMFYLSDIFDEISNSRQNWKFRKEYSFCFVKGTFSGWKYLFLLKINLDYFVHTLNPAKGPKEVNSFPKENLHLWKNWNLKRQTKSTDFIYQFTHLLHHMHESQSIRLLMTDLISYIKCPLNKCGNTYFKAFN